jgi:hypothetical protein
MLNWSCEWYDPQGRLSIQDVVEEFTVLALAGLGANQLRVGHPMPRSVF